MRVLASGKRLGAPRGDVGLVVEPDWGVYAVLDGHGRGGAAAAQVVLESALQHEADALNASLAGRSGALRDALLRCVRIVTRGHWGDAALDDVWCGVSLTLACTNGRRAVVIHAGSTRAYVSTMDSTGARTGVLTADHPLAHLSTLPDGAFQAAAAHHALARSVARQDTDGIDVHSVELVPGHALLLCTEAVWSPFAPRALFAHAARGTLAETCRGGAYVVLRTADEA